MDRLHRRLEAIARSLRPDELGPRPLLDWFVDARR
jgi:hypothetical protein